MRKGNRAGDDSGFQCRGGHRQETVRSPSGVGTVSDFPANGDRYRQHRRRTVQKDTAYDSHVRNTLPVPHRNDTSTGHAAKPGPVRADVGYAT
ncbi:hypothetical protein Dvul_1961 [Nitratidesulfovibrio vulgaris DP4]|uniref:Uncharacterized protein n=1 Tax=Nitratidesulfovibrio vulgaris (strain DP4) TaxID=391774 RepID=A0A0H3A8N9_NITV4|nr:hypothetical protein Dvul_1961 [Nitratidesulfovibrio vulgaris DP4]